MKVKHIFQVMMLTSILPLSSFVNDDETTTEKQDILFSNESGSGVDEKTLTVPVTATVSNSVLNVNFTGTVPVASVTVTNTLTGSTVSQNMSATVGTVCTVPVSTGMYVVSVTDEESGKSVSGEFEVEEEE